MILFGRNRSATCRAYRRIAAIAMAGERQRPGTRAATGVAQLFGHKYILPRKLADGNQGISAFRRNHARGLVVAARARHTAQSRMQLWFGPKSLRESDTSEDHRFWDMSVSAGNGLGGSAASGGRRLCWDCAGL